MAGPKIRLTRHVMERLPRRGIGLRVLRETIRNPDRIEPGNAGRKMAVKTFGNYTYVITPTEVRAITAYVRHR
jgi:hypothetical protein